MTEPAPRTPSASAADGVPGHAPDGVLGRVAGLARRAWWRAADYAYVVRRQAVGLVRAGQPDPGTGPGADVVLVPGVYEPWHFLRPLAEMLRDAGHRVHAVPTLGYNSRPIAATAAVLSEVVRGLDREVVVVAHSKGGLVGKLAMLEPGSPIRHMVAIATPFAGSSLARFVPLPAVRAFVPTDATLVALAAEQDVHARITSVFSHWDPHIPAGSVLAGAANVELRTPGHFRVLTDPELPGVVLRAIRDACGDAVR